MPLNVLTVNTWRNVMKDELKAIFDLHYANWETYVRMRDIEKELYALSIVFFCKYGKFPDEV
jgi:hypothetical protein